MSITNQQWLSEASDQLRQRFDERQPGYNPKLEARLLLCHVLDVSMTHLLSWPDKEIPQDRITLLSDCLDRRLSGAVGGLVAALSRTGACRSARKNGCGWPRSTKPLDLRLRFQCEGRRPDPPLSRPRRRSHGHDHAAPNGRRVALVGFETGACGGAGVAARHIADPHPISRPIV